MNAQRAEWQWTFVDCIPLKYLPIQSDLLGFGKRLRYELLQVGDLVVQNLFETAAVVAEFVAVLVHLHKFTVVLDLGQYSIRTLLELAQRIYSPRQASASPGS
jgi:hypothetical protein